MGHKPIYVSGKHIVRYYKKQSLVIQAVQKPKRTSKSSEVPMAPPLNWLNKKQMRLKQWSLAKEKLQALEQMG